MVACRRGAVPGTRRGHRTRPDHGRPMRARAAGTGAAGPYTRPRDTPARDPDQRQGRALHRVGHPRDDPARVAHGGVNLAQGFPDFPAPDELKDAACAAIQADVNQYAITWGAQALRDAIAEKTAPATRAGSRIRSARSRSSAARPRAMIAAMMAVVDPGRRGRRLRAVLRELRARRDPLRRDAALRARCDRPTGASIPTSCAAAFARGRAAIVLNTPHNPTGKVFTREELEQIAALCQRARPAW